MDEPSNTRLPRIAVIGAGLSGLVCAQALGDCAIVSLFEKSRGYGGRMSTRRHGQFQFDHGAQFFTVQSKSFESFLKPYIEQGVVARWDARFVELDGNRVTDRHNWSSDTAHYVGVPGMNSLASAIGEKLEVQLSTRVGEICGEGGKWRLQDSEGRDLGQFEWVVSSAPARQAITLLPDTFVHREVISNCSMPGCYALMLGFTEPLTLDWDAALVKQGAIRWISDNNSKPGRDDDTSLLVQASNRWSETNMERTDSYVIEHLVAETSRVLGQDVSCASHLALHRWRYANPGQRQGSHALIDNERQLAAIGDWCIGGRVESAYLSGLDAAQRIRSQVLSSAGY